jgi:hypothetical protein
VDWLNGRLQGHNLVYVYLIPLINPSLHIVLGSVAITILLPNIALGEQFFMLNVASKFMQLLSCVVNDIILLLIRYIELMHYTFYH